MFQDKLAEIATILGGEVSEKVENAICANGLLFTFDYYKGNFRIGISALDPCRDEAVRHYYRVLITGITSKAEQPSTTIAKRIKNAVHKNADMIDRVVENFRRHHEAVERASKICEELNKFPHVTANVEDATCYFRIGGSRFTVTGEIAEKGGLTIRRVLVDSVGDDALDLLKTLITIAN